MNILVLGNASWDNTNSVGNTLSNWFDGWTDVEFAYIYNRAAKPNNNVCKKYYSVSPTDLLNNFFRPSKIGKSFFYDTSLVNDTIDKETTLINKTQGWKRRTLKFAVEKVLSSEIWLNKKLKKFILDFKPDIVFTFAIADSYRYNLLKYIKLSTKAKIVFFIADDIYGAYCKENNLFARTQKKRLLQMFSIVDKVYGASTEMCNRYNEIFGIDVTPLYKGCNLCKPRKTINNPIQITYAGNLLYGRDEILGVLAKSINEINKDEFKIKLAIYSNSFIDEKKNNLLNIPGSSELCGCRPFSEIQEILKRSDIVLHVESFDKSQMEVVKYSFSTKIIDCLQSGTSMMVIGPKGISSIEYPRKINGVIVLDNVSDIIRVLNSIVNNPKILLANAASINKYAVEHHDLMNVRTKLRCELESLINK